MRKIVVASALALAVPAAFGQMAPNNTIELYGIVDVGVESIDNGSVSATTLTSGISTGSRFGIRGNEDLGGGYRAIFTLENRFEVDTGLMSNNRALFKCDAVTGCPGITLFPPATALPPSSQGPILGGVNAVNAALLDAVSTVNSANALFDRQAYVGLITPFGAVLAGRQYTPNYEVLVKGNSFFDGFAGNPGQIAAINIRANNALQYRAELAGFTASLMYGFGGSEGNRNERSSSPTGGDDFFGGNLQYNTKRFGLGVAYQRNYTVQYFDPTKRKTGLETFSVTGNVTLGPVKLFALYHDAKNDHPVLRPEDIQNLVISTGGNVGAIQSILGGLYIGPWDIDGLRGFVGPIDLNLYHLGLQWTFGNNQILVALNQSKDKARSVWATQDATTQSYGLAYYYHMSRRSSFYLSGALANNKDQARAALGAACCRGGWTTDFGEDSRVLQAGIRHTF